LRKEVPVFSNTAFMLRDGVIAQVVAPRPIHDTEPRIAATPAIGTSRARVQAPSRRSTRLFRKLRSANA
jgi:hypothetical protein